MLGTLCKVRNTPLLILPHCLSAASSPRCPLPKTDCPDQQHPNFTSFPPAFPIQNAPTVPCPPGTIPRYNFLQMLSEKKKNLKTVKNEKIQFLENILEDRAL